MKKIIIINGTGTSGKDTFVLKASKHAKVKNFSSIDKIREVLATYGGYEGGKTDKDRKFLSDVKNLTTEYNDFSFNETKEAVKTFLDTEEEIMFIHIREPEEIKKAVLAFNATTLLIKREGLENIKTNDADKNVDNYNYDFVIPNTSLEELERYAKEFVENLTKEEMELKKVKK